MATFPCSIEEFNVQFCEFQKIAGSTNSSQNEVALAHKCLCLHYFGINDTSEIEDAAMTLKVATRGALARGWHLIEPDLSGTV